MGRSESRRLTRADYQALAQLRYLLRRHYDRADRRRVLLTVTRRGEAHLARLSRAHREELARLAPLLQTLLKRVGPPEASAGPT